MNIKVKDAFKEYNGRSVLDIKELDFEEGHIYAILGLNGSGKTTLLQCASGLEVFSKGEVFYDGCSNINDIKKNISIMTQKPYLFNTSVLDNLKIGLRFRKYSEDEIEKRISDYLSYFDIEDLLNINAKKLSGGEQAKVALLRTAVIETDVTFLDEPTASMDIESTLRAEKLIRNMALGKRTVIIVTHDLYQAERVADYVVFLDKGRIIEEGDTYKVLNFPKHNLVKQILKRGADRDRDNDFNY